MFLGEIKKLDDDELWIDGSTREELGRHYGLVLRFADVLRFLFDDTRLLQHQDPELTKQVQGMSESYLSMNLGACKCAIFPLRLPEEIPFSVFPE